MLALLICSNAFMGNFLLCVVHRQNEIDGQPAARGVCQDLGERGALCRVSQAASDLMRL